MPTSALNTHDSAPFTPSSKRGTIKHFDACRDGTSKWDGLRRDANLWLDDGDCSVHFYSLGGSQRGPSLRLSFAEVEATRSDYLLERCLHCRDSSSPPPSSDDGASDSGYASSRVSRSDLKQYDLYIPAPACEKGENAYAYHLTTRNFFAYHAGKPVVGEKLGVALAELLARIREWQPDTAALADFMSYCQRQGYEDMAHNADHALACLALAEHAKIRDLWVESFAHCVGMHEQLDLSSEYPGLDDTTKALITRASLEMDLHTERVIRAISTFLEEELGPEHLGLTKAARNHLDRFRSCLNNYYVDKLGYFPPRKNGPWNKRLWTKMYHAFQTLYAYLVDENSSTDAADGRNVTGGTCVKQNVHAFDQRHGYTPLPHPAPLLPEASVRCDSDVSRGLLSLKLGKSDPGLTGATSTRQALAQAANASKPEVMSCELVREYQRFERQKLEEKLNPAEARKVRWLLIYGMLQMLISITRAPKEVRDTDSPLYPLCVFTAGLPPWLEEHDSVSQQDRRQSFVQAMLVPQPTKEDDDDDRISIHPDCEADSAEDYFANSFSRQPSQVDLANMMPQPLRITTQFSRTASFRSSVHSGVNALQRSFSRRNSIMKMPLSRPESISSSLCEMSAHGLEEGNKAQDDISNHGLLSYTETPTRITEEENLGGFDFGLDRDIREPVLEDDHVDRLFESPITETSSASMIAIPRNTSEASFAGLADSYPNSNRSSTLLSGSDTPITAPSSVAGNDDKCASELRWSSSSSVLSHPSISAPTRWQSYGKRPTGYGARTSGYSISAGCYTPTGLSRTAQPALRKKPSLPLSKFSQARELSVNSMQSSKGSPRRSDELNGSSWNEEASRGRRGLRFDGVAE